MKRPTSLATGRMPRSRPEAIKMADNLKIGVGWNDSQQVVIDFNKPVQWMGLDYGSAMALVELITNAANRIRRN